MNEAKQSKRAKIKQIDLERESNYVKSRRSVGQIFIIESLTSGARPQFGLPAERG